MKITQTTTFSAATLGAPVLGGGLFSQTIGDTVWLYFSANGILEGQTTVRSITLGPAATSAEASAGSLRLMPEGGSDLAIATLGGQTIAYSFDGPSAALTSTVIGANGAPGSARVVQSSAGALTGITEISVLEGAGRTHLATAGWGQAGIRLFEAVSAISLSLTHSIPDTPKSYLADVSDTASLQIGGQNYLLTLSALENGLTSFRIDSRGRAELVDSLGTIDGLAITGASAMALATSGGQIFAVIASTGSNSLTTVRVNELGCLFPADHVIDNRETRFANPAALDIFQIAGRSFVATAGSDGGVSLMELLPGGTLQHFRSFELATGAGSGNPVTGIDTAVRGTLVDLTLTDAGRGSITRHTLDFSDLGPRIASNAANVQGTAGDDLIVGDRAAQKLYGNDGDDRIVDGGGFDELWGGRGADVFELISDSHRDIIRDYERGIDRIDISAWGRVYSAEALTITTTARGAEVSYRGNSVLVETLTGTPLSASDFADGHFIFD